MAKGPRLGTERLLLRRWTSDDLAPFAEMNRDPAVMEHFPEPLTESETAAFIDRIERHFDEHGFGLWAVETIADGSFIGYVGLLIPSFDAHFMPAVEIGWRLASRFWGNGYATEAAIAVRDHAFADIGLDALVSMCVPQNKPSWRVMERIGMTHDATDDFAHPAFEPGHRLSRHILYRMDRRQWRAARLDS